MASAAAAVIPDGRRWSKGPGSSSSSQVTTAIFLFFFVVVVGVLVSARWITTTVSAEFIFLFSHCDLNLVAFSNVLCLTVSHIWMR